MARAGGYEILRRRGPETEGQAVFQFEGDIAWKGGGGLAIEQVGVEACARQRVFDIKQDEVW
ncbi:hypothetical protein D3C85_1873230 [compost metagenome]